MNKTAIIGDKDSIYGFSTIGIATFPVFSAQKAGEIVERLADGGYAVIYITDDIAAKIEDIIIKYRDCALPAIIPVPGLKGGEYGMQSMIKMIERATGVAVKA